ncbi:HesA/MoeB/ThiF family protein [Proteiniclasticum sp. QWL-01]|uniref:HesA/MoeB/ThiF family protein n=1 Tax=Proteiniclasticum sp. QWL-01 TaxID=3036945 RepID=UPI0021FF9C19|nr:HesA/MoeB/ThiF family protein [Proteiniclasticum sp. QWL-01]UUM11172.1 HesA/MoeB/ThiF family protein [Clostridiaceae bacterium HFYG-1003]WFF72512.1 HesA/MoeB/ThiF family protein [Proteiniclasticum sp. QWL-01]
MERYQKNEQALSPAENRALRQKAVVIVGLGGLGGYAAEFFSRLGVRRLTLIDHDVFVPTNLNRQLNSYPDRLGESKAEAARERINRVNPGIEVIAHQTELTAANAADLLTGHDLIMDCLDSIQARLILEDAAEALNLPLIHGAIGGWTGQVSVILPGDQTLHHLYRNQTKVSDYWGNPVFTASAIASIQVSEAVKVLLDRDDTLHRKLLVADFSLPEFIILDLPAAE